ncbi:MAG: hypothetical protein AAF628_12150 [Planctomycetota bacterium]
MRWTQIALWLCFGGLALASDGRAQCQEDPGTGCEAAPSCSGSAAIGGTVVLTAPCVSGGGALAGAIAGACPRSPIDFDDPALCTTPCPLGVAPSTAFALPPGPGSGTLTLPIPFAPGLAGLAICVQCVCIRPTGCFTLCQAVRIDITR